ncbi:DUF2946 family protein [uncultured Rhodoblastus sp.]|uniref:DUF2946 family protein n=1 Tax=uncultured Rhodoblastus sp. TaxID=543037 RepID=UPI0025E5C7F7|nr:DUF2946 family protein [uncultured Rhodoblastus sp.]
MAQDLTRTGHGGGWRRIVAGLAVVVLILQGLSLFAPPSRAKTPAEPALAAFSGLPGAELAGTILCLNGDEGDFSGKRPVHRHDPGDCPMCQIVGASLAAVAASGEPSAPPPRESAEPAIPPGEAAPRAPPHFASSPRGPPSIV